MKNIFGWSTLVALTCSALILATQAGAQEAGKEAKPTSPPPMEGDAKDVPFPNNYRVWTHVKSMTIYGKKNPLFDAFGGVHHIYANKKALTALREGKGEYPDGSVFVFDLLELDRKPGAFVEGKRKFVATIYKDAQKYADTSGWGWQAWEGGNSKKPVLKNLADQQVCATCHRNEVSDKGFVFTQWRR